MEVFGYDDHDHGGHAELAFHDVRVPVVEPHRRARATGSRSPRPGSGPAGSTTACASIGVAERGDRADVPARGVRGSPSAGRSPTQGVVRDWIAESRVRIEQLRLLVLKTAWLMDTVGNRGAHTEIQAIKIATPQTVQWILDKAIQVHGAGGLSQDFPLAERVRRDPHAALRRRPRRGAQELPGQGRDRPADGERRWMRTAVLERVDAAAGRRTRRRARTGWTSCTPASTPGLAWVHFPEGLGGLGLPRSLQPVVDKALVRGRRPGQRPAAHRHRPRHGRADDPRVRHRRAEAALPAAALVRRGGLVPAVLRARRRLRPRRPRDPRRPRRRRLDRQRPEGVDVLGAHRRPGDPDRPHRPRRPQARGPHRTSSSTCTTRASRSGRCARSPARPSSTRSS